MKVSRNALVFVTVAALTLFLSVSVKAQTGLGAINGIVRDSTGATVPDSTITLVSLQTGAQRVVTTSSLGYYVIPALPPGEYKLTVEKAGFVKQSIGTVALRVQENLTIDLALTLGSVVETVSVTGQAPVLEATNTTIGQVIGAKQTVDLPLNGRQFSQLLLLSPGAAPRGGAQQAGFTVQVGSGGISPAVNGQPGNYNNYTLDGLDNNSRFSNIWAVSPPPDAIQEFKVETNGYAGANVNIATRSGTDSFHGAAWEFLRNDALDARNTFDFQKPPYRQNQYGVAAGGPLFIPKVMDGRKSHSWIFGYWEGFRSRKAQTLFATVPTPAMLTGDFSQLKSPLYNPFSTRADPANPNALVRDAYPGNIIPRQSISQPALDYLAHFYPAPNLPVFPNNLVSAQSTAVNSDQWGLKFDHRLGNSDSFFLRANVNNATARTPSPLPTNPLYLDNRTRTFGGGYTHLFSPTMLFNATVGFTRDYTINYSTGVGSALQQELGMQSYNLPFNGYYVAQTVTISPNFSGVTEKGQNLGAPDQTYNFNGTLTKIHGNHSLSAGVSALKWRYIANPSRQFTEGFTQLTTANPAATATTGDGMASFLLGLPTSTAAAGSPDRNNNGVVWDLFFADQWKVTPKLTLNLGLNWNYRYGPFFKNGQISIFDLAQGRWRWSTTNPITGEPANLPESIYRPDRNNFAPRVGLAYQLTSKTVLRSGYSIFYDHSNSLVQAQQELTGGYPYGGRPSLTNINTGIPSSNTFINPLPAGLTGISALSTPGFTANTDSRTPYVIEWNAGFQQEIARNTVLSVDYVGTRGRKLFMHVRANIAHFPAAGALGPRQDFPQFGPISYGTDIGNSDYHSLQTKIEKRFSQGLTFLGSYTWSKALGITSGPQDTTTVQDTYNINGSRGPLSYDMRQMFVFTSVYELPFGKRRQFMSHANGFADAIFGGWNVSGIVSVYTGFPLTVTLPFDNANTGSSIEFANVVSAPVPSDFGQNRQHWFDTHAFVTPKQFTYGSAGVGLMRGPGVRNFDFNAVKQFSFGETRRLEFRFESFNLLNNTNLGDPNVSLGNLAFGTITSAKSPRDIQFGAKFIF